MKERNSATEAAEEIAAATVEFTTAAAEIAAVTAGFTASAAEDMAAFYIDCTKRVIKLCDDKRKEVQSNLARAADEPSKET